MNKNVTDAYLKSIVLRGISVVNHTGREVCLSDEMISLIVEKAKKALNPTGYAFRSGRNRAVDVLRARERAPKVAANKFAKAQKRVLHEQELENDKKARKELDDIISQLLVTKPSNFLEIIYRTYILLEDDECLQKTWPQSSRNVRDQWRCRGKAMIRKISSDNLKRYLKKNPIIIRRERKAKACLTKS